MSESDRLLGWALTRPTMTYLGQVSYGTYLWHWPVLIVLAELLDLGPWPTAALAGVLATALAALSFQLLENPLRRARSLAGLTWPVLGVGLAVSALLAVTLVPGVLHSTRPPSLAAAGGGPAAAGETRGRPIPPDLDWAALLEDKGHDETWCTPADLTRCRAHAGDGDLDVLLVGDSHGRMLAPVLTTLAAEHDFTLHLSLVGHCSWQLGVRNPGVSDQDAAACREAREGLYDEVVPALGIDVVVLTQLPRVSMLRPAEGDEQVDGPRLAVTSVRETLETIEAAGARAVIVESALVPDKALPDPLGCLAEATRTDECRFVVSPRTSVIDAVYRSEAAGSEEVATVDLNPIMCPGWPVCEPILGGLPVWRDKIHFLPSTIEAHADQVWARLDATGFFTAG